ncbi:hypothetical protein HDZ31DRAFT_67420 [Schizophyllum fasciatum]
MDSSSRAYKISKELSRRFPTSGSLAPAPVKDEFDDMVDPDFERAVLNLDYDAPPAPGYCLVPFFPSILHTTGGRDVRWDKTFNTFFVVLDSVERAGGVYTEMNDVNFHRMGLDPQPTVVSQDSWLGCVEIWKGGCRSGIHGHVPPSPMTPKAKAPISQSSASSHASGTPPKGHAGARQPITPTSSPITPTKARGAAGPLGSAASSLHRGLRAPGRAPGMSAVMPGIPAAVVIPNGVPPIPAGADLRPSEFWVGSSKAGGAHTPLMRPVWYVRDPMGLGMVLTNDFQHAKQLLAKYGEIGIATDIAMLQDAVKCAFEK